MTSTSERLLQEVELFAGLDLRGLHEVLTPVELAVGEELWRQGDPADALYVIASGRIGVGTRLPGGRLATLGELGPNEVVGELALLDSGPRTASVRTLEPARLLRLPYGDFRAIVRSRDPGARELRQRLIRLACRRLLAARRQLPSRLSNSIGDRPEREEEAGPTAGPVAAPDQAYMLRLSFFREYTRPQLDALLGRCSVERVQRGSPVVAAGERPRRLFVVLNGAVEQVKRLPGGTIRAALHGPGRGFGYSILVSGGTSAGAWTARERTVVLAIPGEVLWEEIEHDPFTGALERDLVTAVRQAERPQGRLAALGEGGLMTQLSA